MERVSFRSQIEEIAKDNSFATDDSLAIVGIDPSMSSTGWCVLAGDQFRSGSFKTDPETPRMQRLIDQRNSICQLLLPFAGCERFVVAMESEIWGLGPAQGSEQAMIQAVYQTLIWEYFRPRGAKFLSVNPQHVKGFIGAKEKEKILLQVYKHFGVECLTNDQADAIVIAKIAQATVATDSLKLNQAQLAVIAKVQEKGWVWDNPVKAKLKGKGRKGKATLRRDGLDKALGVTSPMKLNLNALGHGPWTN